MKFKKREQIDWHLWFAWYPIHTQCGHIVWLETVQRRFNEGYDGATIHYEPIYKL